MFLYVVPMSMPNNERIKGNVPLPSVFYFFALWLMDHILNPSERTYAQP